MTKLERVNKQITKSKTIISEQQERLRELEQQKTEIENKDIIKTIRSFKYSKDELMAMFESREKEHEGYNNSQTASYNAQFDKEDFD